MDQELLLKGSSESYKPKGQEEECDMWPCSRPCEHELTHNMLPRPLHLDINHDLCCPLTSSKFLYNVIVWVECIQTVSTSDWIHYDWGRYTLLGGSQLMCLHGS